MARQAPVPEEVRRGLSELVALSALPDAWAKLEPEEMVSRAAAELSHRLKADLVFVSALPENHQLGSFDAAYRRGRKVPSNDVKVPSTGAANLIAAPIGGRGRIVVRSSERALPPELAQAFVTTTANALASAIGRWEAAADSERLVRLIDRVREFVGLADADGNAEYVNAAGLAMVGLDRLDPAHPLHLLDFAMGYEVERLRERILPIVVGRGRWIGEVDLRHFGSGEPIPSSVDLFCIDNPVTGRVMNVATIGSDLRPRLDLEEKLRDVDARVEAKVVERTSELSERNAHLTAEMADRRRMQERLELLQLELSHATRLSVAGEMAATMAHELSQPLVAILNSLSATRRLLASNRRAKDVSVRELIEDASVQAERASEIIRRLRYFIARGSSERLPQEVAPMLEEAVAFAVTGPDSLGVNVSYYLDPTARYAFVDRVQIQQVISNLVRNAIEAMQNSRRREITITTRPVRGGMIEITIADSGPGVPARIRKQLFKPFTSTKPDGMGLGLSISRSIVEAHGGRLTYEPRNGDGSAFRFTVAGAPEPSG